MFKYGWENWQKESEEGRQSASINISCNNNVSHHKEFEKKMNNKSNEPNLLAPLISSLWDCGSLILNKLIKPRFDLEKYFKSIEMKNKQEVYPTRVARYKGDKGEIEKFSIPIGFNVDDFIKEKENIESQLNKKVEIRYKNKYIEIETIDI